MLVRRPIKETDPVLRMSLGKPGGGGVGRGREKAFTWGIFGTS